MPPPGKGLGTFIFGYTRALRERQRAKRARPLPLGWQPVTLGYPRYEGPENGFGDPVPYGNGGSGAVPGAVPGPLKTSIRTLKMGPPR